MWGGEEVSGVGALDGLELGFAHGSFKRGFGEAGFGNVVHDLDLGLGQAVHQAFDELDNVFILMGVGRIGLPGRWALCRAEVFVGVGVGEDDFAFMLNVDAGLLADGATLMFCQGHDANRRVGGMPAEGEGEAGGFGAEAGEGAILAVFVEAVLARDQECAVGQLGEGGQFVPEFVERFAIGLAARFEEFFE